MRTTHIIDSYFRQMPPGQTIKLTRTVAPGQVEYGYYQRVQNGFEFKYGVDVLDTVDDTGFFYSDDIANAENIHDLDIQVVPGISK